MLLALTIAGASASYSQTSDLNTAQTPTVTVDQTIAFLLSENETSRQLIQKQTARITSLEAELSAEKENSESTSRSYENAKSEITSLRTANAALERAVALNEKTIALLQTDLEKTRREKKKWRNRTIKLAGTVAVIVLTKFL
jgi:chromosome segregation ATPase